jgi:DHHC palmitoyltransferase
VTTAAYALISCVSTTKCFVAIVHSLHTYTQQFFIQFICYTFLLCLYALALVVGRFVNCVGAPPGAGTADTAGTQAVPPGETGSAGESSLENCLEGGELVLLLIVESLLFGMFTMCMAFDQLQSATSGQTQIDRLKVRATLEFCLQFTIVLSSA